MKRFTIVLFVLGLASFAGSMQNDAWAIKKETVVDCSKGNLIADAIAGGAAQITILGTCTEIVTVTADGITFIGDPGVGGTLMGGFIVDGAQRFVIDDLTIDGSTNTERLDGVRAKTMPTSRCGIVRSGITPGMGSASLTRRPPSLRATRSLSLKQMALTVGST